MKAFLPFPMDILKSIRISFDEALKKLFSYTIYGSEYFIVNIKFAKAFQFENSAAAYVF